MTDNLSPDVVRIPLNALWFGHEADPPINVRTQGREDEIDKMAASIAAHGLLQPLLVREDGGRTYVADGNRRLAALRSMLKAGAIAEDVPIACAITTGSGREISLASNFERLPLHELDQYEAFASLRDGGLNEDQISARFGLDTKYVRKVLALGGLSPVIRDAWRKGAFEHQATAMVRAFTLGSTHADQERVFKKLKKSGQLWPNVVRSEFGASQRDVPMLIRAVGLDAYRAAGGTLTEDLFGDEHAIHDLSLLQRLGVEAIAARVAELIEEGWSWAAAPSELPEGARWSWRSIRLDAERKAKYSAEEKATAGCIVSLGNNGLEVRYGVLKPEAARKADRAAAGPAAKAGGGKTSSESAVISNALATDVSVWVTAAARQAIQADPKQALAALLAGFAVYSYDAPVKVKSDGLAAAPLGDSRNNETYEAVFDRYRAMTVEELQVVAAGVAALSLSFHVSTAGHSAMTVKGGAALLNAIDPAAMNAALLRAFDAEDFFKRASAAIATAALKEMHGPDGLQLPKKAPELKVKAAADAKQLGWLPVEMRTAHYDGPGKTVAEAKPKKPARRKKAEPEPLAA